MPSGQLRITIPAAISGYPSQGMGKRAWNLVLRNVSRSSACSLRGWPGLAVQDAAGQVVATKVSHVTVSNIASVPVRRITVRPGQSAVTTVTSATAAPGCVTSWTLRVALPGASRPVTVSEPSGAFRPCLGGDLRLLLSPFYLKSTGRHQGHGRNEDRAALSARQGT